jgi:hypothetical protein
MELGCGVRVMTVKGRGYLYVWHYETRDGRRKQEFDYIGPATDPEARRKASEALDTHTRKAMEEARRRLRAGRIGAMAVHR